MAKKHPANFMATLKQYLTTRVLDLGDITPSISKGTLVDGGRLGKCLVKENIHRVGFGPQTTGIEFAIKELQHWPTVRMTRDNTMTEVIYKEIMANYELMLRYTEISHPNLVCVHHVARKKDVIYVLMDLVKGVNLTSARLSESNVRLCVGQLLDILSHLHAKKLPYLQLERSKVMVTSGGVIKLLPSFTKADESGMFLDENPYSYDVGSLYILIKNICRHAEFSSEQKDFLKRCQNPKSENPEDVMKELLEHNFIKVPEEILFRGPAAQEAYHHALSEGYALDRRVRLMFIGQEGAGKTSLKKSLLGQKFDPKELSTEAIVSDVQVTVDSCQAWDTGEDSRLKRSFSYQAAKCVLEKLKGSKKTETVSQTTHGLDVSLASKTSGDVVNQLQHENDQPEDMLGGTSEPKVDISPVEPSAIVHDDIPDDIIVRMRHLMSVDESDRGKEIPLCPDLWDFAGQALFYATHAVFMSRRAVYILVYNIEKELLHKAEPRKTPGTYGVVVDSDSNESNLDYINFWLSSVHSLQNRFRNDDTDTSTPSDHGPPVILVFTNADKISDSANRKRRVLQSLGTIVNNLGDKSFGNNLITDNVFCIDNTKSGNGKHEDPQVRDLRELISEVAESLPHTRERIPMRWLKAEELISCLLQEGKFYLSTIEFQNILNQRCEIRKEAEFKTLVDFLHDRGVLMHFKDTQALSKLVVLKAQWLIDLFKKIITVPHFYAQKNEPKMIMKARQKLEKEGTLSKELIEFVCEQIFGRREDVTLKAVISLMELFSLICKWVNADGSCIYMVPCMLRSLPEESVTRATEATDLHPIYICFPDGYVPMGLYPRLVAMALKWSSLVWPVSKPRLYRNFVRMQIGESGDFEMVMASTMYHIKICLLWEESSENLQLLPGMCTKVVSFLEQSLKQMKDCFHWLRGMQYHIAMKCTACFGENNGVQCTKHRDPQCRNDDCAHLVPIDLHGSDTRMQCEKVVTRNKTVHLDSRWLCDKSSDCVADVPELETGPATQKFCRDVSKFISSQNWKKILRLLGLKDSFISQIDNDYSKDGVREKVYQGLLAWVQRGQADVKQLIDVLYQVDEQVLKELKGNQALNSQEPAAELDKEVTEELCHIISERVSYQWKWLLRYLNIQERIIRNIELDANPSTVQEQCFQGLLYWQRVLGRDARLSKVMISLQAIGRDDVVKTNPL